MLDIARSPQEGVRCRVTVWVGLELAHKQEYPVALFPVMDIPLSGRGAFGGSALALPVEQNTVYGVIVIHGRGGIVLV